MAVGLAVLGGGAAGADPLPTPLDTAAASLSAATQPQTLDAGGGPDRPQEPSPLRPLDGVTGRVDALLPGDDGTGDGTGDGAVGTDQGSGTGSGEPSADGGQGQGSDLDDTQGDREGETAPAEASAPREEPGTGARATSEAVTACVIPTRSGSPAVEFDLSVLGNDAGSPLAEGIPQVFTPCPEGAVAADDTVVGAEVDVEGLLGACVRVTREVAPLQTTLVVLDHDVIAALADAGLPLEQLVVPCPAGASRPGTPTDPGPSGDAPSDRPASAVPSLPGRLAFTGADPLPLASLAVALLSLGAVLTRRAARLRPCASRG